MRGPHNIVRLVRTLATFERTGAIGVVLEAFGSATVAGCRADFGLAVQMAGVEG